MKRYTFYHFIFLTLLLMIFIVSCTNNSIPNNTNSTNSNLSILDITNAKELFITSGNISKDTTSKDTTNKLFKITNDGYVEEVKYLDDEGNEISIENQPVAIYNVNDQYIIVCFGWDELNIDSGYLVRKSDGAVFSLANAGYPYKLWNYFTNANPIYTDSNGNIYYLSTVYDGSYPYQEIVKLNTTDLNNITKESYSPDTDNVDTFLVDPNGNAVYNGYLRSNNNPICRIRKANGGLSMLPDISSNYWLGPDGNIYYYYDGSIKKIDTSNDDASPPDDDYASSLTFLPHTYGSYQAVLKDRVIFINIWDKKIYEVYNLSETPREVTLSGITFQSLTCADYSQNFYYIAGVDENSQSFLIKVDPTTNDSPKGLLQRGTYDIYKMTVSSDDEITFNALRMSDGAKIIGKIDSNENLTIIDETLNSELVYLERIK